LSFSLLQFMIWQLHNLARKFLPKRTIQYFRSILEVRLNTFWMSKGFSSAGEDLVLRSLLWRRDQARGLPELSRTGYFVDVGAFAPKQFSNTYMFYRYGWRGINIDAAPGSMKLFKRARPHDVNLEHAVSNVETHLDFYTWGTPMVVNTLSATHAKEFAKHLGKEPEIVRVTSRTLESILDEHLPPNQKIDFLSVDAESHDIEVLQSNNWSRYRPHLVIVEVYSTTFSDMQAHPIVKFMQTQDYQIAAWVFPNVIFQEN